MQVANLLASGRGFLRAIRKDLLIYGLSFKFIFLLFSPALALDPSLLKLPLEDLMKIEVTSAAKRPQKMSEIASAVYVLTPEDILQGFDNQLPDLLRDVPGVHVARITSSDWAISIRGFNDRFSNKLLVMMDGRTLYTPLFSGVFWERQDYILDDLARIEVIRGPGASLWGSNAVNGIINILTKSAWETQGFLAKAVGGEEESLAALRYGNHNDKLAYRVYLKAREIDSQVDEKGHNTHDDWRTLQAGFRLDTSPENDYRFRLSGDAYTMTTGIMYKFPYKAPIIDDGYGSGYNVLAKLEKRGDPVSWHLQAYYDHSRAVSYPLLNWSLDIYDLEYQLNFDSDRHKWSFGLGYRLYVTDIKNTELYIYDPSETKTYVFNAFLQDEIYLSPHVGLILGSKFEYHEDTGLEVQPTARVFWQPNPKTTLWAAVSRAVRIPSKGELDIILNVWLPPEENIFLPLKEGSFPILLHIEGNDDLDAEKLVAFEAGIRSNLKKQLYLDLSLFLNLYSDLIGVGAPKEEPVFVPDPVPHFYAFLQDSNFMDGESYGLELALNADPTENLRFKLSYTYLKLFLHADTPSIWFGEELEKQWPRHILSFRMFYRLSDSFYFNSRLRYVSEVSSYHIPSYWATDVALFWKPCSDLEISFTGQNIFDPRHPEFGQRYALSTPVHEVERAFFLKFTWHK